MKIPRSTPLFCLCAILSGVPALLQAAPPKPLPPPQAATPESALTCETFDYYDFAAMTRTPAGLALRARIFEDLKNAQDTAALLARLNEKYAMRVPEEIRRAVIAKFSFSGDESFNTAEFELSGKDTVGTFFDRLGEHAFPWENRQGNIDPADNSPQPAEILRPEDATAARFALPPELRQNLPPDFLENADLVLISSPAPERISVIASSKPLCNVPDFPHLKGYAESLGEASLPGVLIYRKFTRREAKTAGLALSFPPGEFIISENGESTKIGVEFHCRDTGEAAFMEHFFLRFKLSIIDSASRQPKPTREKLRAVGRALKLTRKDTLLKLNIDCASEDFPAFLKWRNTWFPSP